MTPYYVIMTSEHLKLLELLCTASWVNLVTVALTVLKLHRGGGGGSSEAPMVPEGSWFKVHGLFCIRACLYRRTVAPSRRVTLLTEPPQAIQLMNSSEPFT